MKHLIINWLLGTVSLILVSYIIPGFVVKGFIAALIAALVIGLINATLGLFLKIITIPITIVTFGVFLLIINAFILKIASSLLNGFSVSSFWAAFFGAVVLAIINVVLNKLVFD